MTDTKGIDRCQVYALFCVLGKAVMDNAREQMDEINRIREVLLDKGLRALGTVHPRELSLALIMLAVEVHIQGSSMSRREIRQQLRSMVGFLVAHANIVNVGRSN